MKSNTLTSICVSMLAITLSGHAFAADSPDLLHALQAGEKHRFRELLRTGDPNMKDAEGTPLLMNAVLFGDALTVNLVLDRGADPNATNAAGATALIWAAGDPKKVNVLIRHGADVNARAATGRTPLLAAASQDGAESVVRTLIAKGAELEVKDNLQGPPSMWTGGGGSSAVIEAAKARDGRALQALIDAGANLNAVDSHGATALTEAIAIGNRNNVGRLLTAGADANVRVTTLRYTPLMIAATRNDYASVRRLLDAGADIAAQDTTGSTALMWAAYTAETDARILRQLLEAGADANVHNRKGDSALTWAKWHGNPETIELLESARREVSSFSGQ